MNNDLLSHLHRKTKVPALSPTMRMTRKFALRMKATRPLPSAMVSLLLAMVGLLTGESVKKYICLYFMILMHSGNVPEPNIPSSKTLNNRGGDLQFSLPPPSPFLPFARVAKLIWGFCGCWVRADQRWTEKGTTCVGGPAYVGPSVGRSLGGCGLPLLLPAIVPRKLR